MRVNASASYVVADSEDAVELRGLSYYPSIRLTNAVNPLVGLTDPVNSTTALRYSNNGFPVCAVALCAAPTRTDAHDTEPFRVIRSVDPAAVHVMTYKTP